MRYSEINIITEIIANPLGSGLTYDPKRNRVKTVPKSGLLLDKDSGQLIAFERPAPELTLRHLNKIKKLRARFLKQQEKLRKFRHVMYGGAAAIDREQDELVDLKRELKLLKREMDNEIDAASIPRKRKAKLSAMANRHLNKN